MGGALFGFDAMIVCYYIHRRLLVWMEGGRKVYDAETLTESIVCLAGRKRVGRRDSGPFRRSLSCQLHVLRYWAVWLAFRCLFIDLY